jgi:hypothetical protein
VILIIMLIPVKSPFPAINDAKMIFLHPEIDNPLSIGYAYCGFQVQVKI